MERDFRVRKGVETATVEETVAGIFVVPTLSVGSRTLGGGGPSQPPAPPSHTPPPPPFVIPRATDFPVPALWGFSDAVNRGKRGCLKNLHVLPQLRMCPCSAAAGPGPRPGPGGWGGGGGGCCSERVSQWIGLTLCSSDVVYPPPPCASTTCLSTKTRSDRRFSGVF